MEGVGVGKNDLLASERGSHYTLQHTATHHKTHCGNQDSRAERL